ncbi:MAG TPA: YggU family protein [Gammaproteobacteria bacterium]|nr:YggU family protein [Gammaproteobacteria bacterium]
MPESNWFRRQGEDLFVKVYLVPRAQKNLITGVRENELLVRIQSPPVDGKANAALCAFLAKQCGTAKSRVEVVRGKTSRHKTVLISGAKWLPRGVVT